MLQIKHLELDGFNVAFIEIENGPANVLDLSLLQNFEENFKELEQDSRVQGVLLTGKGKCFSAGVDLKKLTDGGEVYIKPFVSMLNRSFRKLFFFSKPLVTAINGHAIAGGCIIAACGDYRLGALGSAKVGLAELMVGVPFPYLPLEIMRYACPHRLQEMVLTAKNYSMDEAKVLGVVDELVPADQLLKRSQEMLLHLMRVPASTFKQTKTHLRSKVAKGLEAEGVLIDQEVDKLWLDPAILQRIRNYLKQLGS